MEKSEYIKRQDQAWDMLKNLSDDEHIYKSQALEALKILAALDLSVDNGYSVLLYQHAKTLLGEAICLYCLDDTLDAIKVLDKLDRLKPSIITPCKDKLKYYQTRGKELRREIIG